MKLGPKRSLSEETGCQNSNVESFLPLSSSDLSDLSDLSLSTNDDTPNLFLSNQDEEMNFDSLPSDSTTLFSAQNDITSDDLVSSNVGYDGFLDPNEDISGSGGGSSNDLAMFVD